MEPFIQSCEQFQNYPQNVVLQTSLIHTQKAHTERLLDNASRLFSKQQAAVDFWDLKGRNSGFQAVCATNLDELKEVLREAYDEGKTDPKCRFVFLHAAHSRAPLNITEEMMKFLFTYHQVIPSFLDFVFPFGQQIRAQDFYFSSPKEESCLDEKKLGLQIPKLGRSGKELRLCYNLRSVERSKGQGHLPWSIRQSAMYHSFDLETGHSVWINVKGNRLIKERIMEASTELPWHKTGSRSESFSASLGIHLLLCDWSCENWRWYINDLEDRFNACSADALALPIAKLPTLVSSPIPAALNSDGTADFHLTRARSWKTIFQSSGSPDSNWESFSPTAPSRMTTLVGDSEDLTETRDCLQHTRWEKLANARSIKGAITSVCTYVRRLGQCTQSSPTEIDPSPLSVAGEKSSPDSRQLPPKQPPAFAGESGRRSSDTFSFQNLQEVQQIEDKAHQVSLILTQNARVLGELQRHYNYTTTHKEFPKDLRSACGLDLQRFYRCMNAAENDIMMFQARVDALLRMISNRKNLLNDILHYRSVKANEFFTKRAHSITVEMHTIAKKTEQETVSMRVITTVTLFFLPATFIATFMSTDILNLQNNQQDVQIRGLKLYLAIALPLTAVTFLAWYMIYRGSKRRSRGGVSHVDIV